MDIQDLVEQLQGHTIVAQSDPDGIWGSYFVAWNGTSTYRIFHVFNLGNSVEEVDVWTSDLEFPPCSERREEYAKGRLAEWMIRS